MSMDDLPQVAAIEAQSQRDPWPQQSFQAEVENARVAQPLVAVRKHEIVGYIVPWFIEDEMQVANIAVKEGFRQQGVGRMLLSHVLHLARQQGCRWAYLEVRESNAAARRLYGCLGFVATGLRPRYYGHGAEDAILMKKELVPEQST